MGADLEAKNDAGQVPAQLTKDRLVGFSFVAVYLGVCSAPIISGCSCACVSSVVAAVYSGVTVLVYTTGCVDFFMSW